MTRKIVFILALMMTLAISVGFAENNALYFDGVNDVVEFANPGPTDMITFECWFNAYTLGSGTLGRTIVSSNPTTSKTFWLTSLGSELRLWAFGNTVNENRFTTSGANIAANTWYHVAVVAQRGASNRTKLYLNGVELLNQASYDHNNFGSTFYLGNLRTNAISEYVFHGLIDEVRVWDVLRTPLEILANMNTVISPYPSSLVAYFPLDSSDGSTVSDLTTPAQNGTAYNGNNINPQPVFVGSDVTLPVELSSFMATGTSDFFVRLSWITQSESDVMGYYIYRNSSPDFTTSLKISDLIQAQNQSITYQYTYVDEEVTEGVWYYWLQNIDYNGTDMVHGPVSYTVFINGQDPGTPDIPLTIGIEKIFPNPFNPSTTISYILDNDAAVNATIYNLKGQIVRQLFRGNKATGNHSLQWNGIDDNGILCSSGVYTVKIQIGTRIYSRNIVMSK